MTDPYATGVLKKETHGRIVADRAYYAQLAGITEGALWEPLSGAVGPGEVELISHYRTWAKKGVLGVLYSGSYAQVPERFEAITACLVRNFIDARLRMLEDVAFDYGTAPTCSVLLIPNFASGDTSPAVANAGRAVVLRRAQQRKPTLLFAESNKLMRKLYGNPLADLVEEKFVGDPR